MNAVQEMIRALANKKPIQAEEAFHRAMSTEALAQMDKLKQKVGSNMCKGK